MTLIKNKQPPGRTPAGAGLSRFFTPMFGVSLAVAGCVLGAVWGLRDAEPRAAPGRVSVAEPTARPVNQEIASHGSVAAPLAADAETLKYAVTFEVGYTLPSAPQAISVSGQGMLELYPVGADGDRLRWVGALQEPSLALDSDSSAFGAVPELLAELEKPFSLTTDARGLVLSVGFRARGPNQGQSILRAVLAVLEFVRPESAAERWSVEEPDSNGRCIAEYAATGATTFSKHKSRCPFLLALQFGSLREATVRAKASYELGRDGRVASASSEESISLPMGEQKVVTSANISLKRAAGRAAANPFPDFEGWVAGPLYGTTESRRERPEEALRWKRDLVQGKSFSSIASSILESASRGDDAGRLKGFHELEALFEVDPASIAPALQALKDKLPPEAIEAIVGGLAGAQSPEAQAALNTLANDPSYDAGVRHHAITHMGMHENPSSETLSTLEKLAKDVEGDQRESATLALGGAARHAAPGSDARARVNSQLERGFELAEDEAQKDLFLAALGNAGSESSLELIRQALQSPDAARRASAVLSLRFIPGDEAAALIAQVLTSDPEPSVRSSAIQALEYRAFDEQVAKLIFTTYPREASSMVRTNMLGLLARNLTNPLPAVVATVRLAQSDQDREVRDLAERLASQIL